MFACQHSFGSVVGAPVVFYVGSFVYALIEVGNSLGDNDTSHALAFGMWWMTIPHIAIINGCLLAGNNPNTLEGIVGHLDSERPISCFHMLGYNVCAPVFEFGYRPAWMWSRGGSKRAWAEKVCDEYNPRGFAKKSG